MLSVVLGALGFGAVLCPQHPNPLTTPDLRPLHPMDLVRGLIQAVLVAAFALGIPNALLGWRRGSGLCGIDARRADSAGEPIRGYRGGRARSAGAVRPLARRCCGGPPWT